MHVRLSELIEDSSKPRTTLVVTPKVLLKLLREANGIGKLHGTVHDMLITIDEDGGMKYSLLPNNPLQN